MKYQIMSLLLINIQSVSLSARLSVSLSLSFCLSVCLSVSPTFGAGGFCSRRGRFRVWESTGEEVSEGHQEIQTDHHPDTTHLHIY